MGMLADATIGLAILGVGSGAVLARRGLTEVALFIAYGLLLCLAWVRLGAVDVAMTEAAIGAGLSGVLLLRAGVRLAGHDLPTEGEAPGPLLKAAIAAGSAGVGLAIAWSVLALPEPAPSLGAAVAAELHVTGLGNPVAGVLMAFRGLDTMLEALVLVLAVICIWSLAPDGGWDGRPGGAPLSLAGGPLNLLARLLPPVGIVVAAHILWVGANGPGGKFQAAAILAAMWLLAWLAGLGVPPRGTSRALRLAVAAGPLLFVATGLLGVASEGAFLAYPAGFEKPIILLLEFALTGSIAVALALMVMGQPEPSP